MFVDKIKVGVLGATGIVGQSYVKLLEKHPWFEVSYVAASANSAGKTYRESVKNRWFMDGDIPEKVADLIVQDANEPNLAVGQCSFVFCALEMDKERLKYLENSYATIGIPVVSNASANRWTLNVPMLIPEINYNHIDVIKKQKSENNWNNGFIVTKPNCSLQTYMMPVHALIKAGYPVYNIIVTTMQAVSGAGYPGVSSYDIINNLIPFIEGEEEKTEQEAHKILGQLSDGHIQNVSLPIISSTCTRVPVLYGHTASVSLKFLNKKPSLQEIENIWSSYTSEPQRLHLPSAPEHPIVLMKGNNHPQPRYDCDIENGMACVVGRLRKCDIMDIKFLALSHNTKRGAALGGILNAELLKAKGYIR